MDFRFGKKLSGERTFTICGMTDSLAPEIVQGKGHGLPADWYGIHIPHRFLRKLYTIVYQVTVCIALPDLLSYWH